MAQVTRHVALGVDAETVWAAIGGFQAIADWHPAVADCVRDDIGAAEHRRLALEGTEDELLEKFLGADTHSYGYAIVDGPLPVSHYRAVISVAPAGAGSIVTWCSTFTPKGEGAEGVIAGIYEAGFAALVERFGAA